MVDISKIKPDLSDKDRDQLLSRIDELENLLAKKKANAVSSSNSDLNLMMGDDGIPVLMETVVEDQNQGSLFDEPLEEFNEEQIVDDIIKKVDEEITRDLDDLISMLKDSLVDEVKARILQELKEKKLSGNNH